MPVRFTTGMTFLEVVGILYCQCGTRVLCVSPNISLKMSPIRRYCTEIMGLCPEMSGSKRCDTLIDKYIYMHD